jgi:hypothetical protein
VYIKYSVLLLFPRLEARSFNFTNLFSSLCKDKMADGAADTSQAGGLSLSLVLMLNSSTDYLEWKRGITDWLIVTGYRSLLTREANEAVQTEGIRDNA